ncbi:MAG: arginyl-tRNA synthetase [Thermoleophilaceae bacterium]|nr:arginyl-tRNA synthetase [Thermoleophilaceae bacterium]
MTDPVSDLRGAVSDAAADLRGDGPVDAAKLDRPPRPDFGDYSTNAAMLLAPTMGEPPRAIAERLGEKLGEQLGSAVERVEIAGPGFLNLFMTDAWYLDSLTRMREAGERFGAGDAGQRVQVEFVSANPTGPITVASARHAAYGDSLARILELAGNTVEREYYVNDAGSQVRKFGESIRARARGEDPEEYKGDYVVGLAERIPGAAGLDPEELARRGVELMLQDIEATLKRFRVPMDRFFSERSLYESGAVDRALEKLEGVYESDGALWMRTTAVGDDKDRVLRRSSGELAYFAADIAYHADKLSRGYDRLINVLGPDHHGYVKRLYAAWAALGGDPGAYEIVIMQLVNLFEGGKRAQMSKREGAIVTLDALVDDIGVDAARWYLTSRSHDTSIDLDLELARSQSQDNPVYYVQYAHARIASILRKAGEERVAAALAADLRQSDERFHPSARSLVKRLLEFPEEVRDAAERRAPHRMTTYATETAQEFSAFYRDCRVVGAAEEGGDEDVRLVISVLAKDVLARSLDLLGVEAPESM